jgi:organic radical activating enzyme
MTKLLISELYDKPTVQGEGPFIGTPCTFMRLGGCNLQCGKGWQTDPSIWKCDSAYTWDWTGVTGKKYDPRTELKKVEVLDIIHWLRNFHQGTKVRMLVVTGGEPMLQEAQLAELFKELWVSPNSSWWSQWLVHMETNGTIAPQYVRPYVSWFSVSPKLANSGNDKKTRFDLEALTWFAETSSGFKFVVNSADDFKEIDWIVSSAGVKPSNVYIMPEGITDQAISQHSKDVLNGAIDRGYNLTTRLHITLFGNTRGT